MADSKEKVEPYSAAQATALIRSILRGGSVRFSTHALDAMGDDDLGEPDVLNCLRCGRILEPAEFERGHAEGVWSWRYRVHTDRICVVVAFRSDDTLVIVTAWRKVRRGR